MQKRSLIQKILSDNGSAILMSHLGRPKNGPEDKFSLKHIIDRIADLTGAKVHFAKDCIGVEAKELSEKNHENSIFPSLFGRLDPSNGVQA